MRHHCHTCQRYYTDAQDCACPRQPDLDDRIRARRPRPHVPEATEDWRDALKGLGASTDDAPTYGPTFSPEHSEEHPDNGSGPRQP